MANATNTCLTVEEGRVFIIINSVFAALGSSANLVTVVLVVWTKAYRQHVHRLTLYLAVLGLIHSAMIGLETLPVDTARAGGDVVMVRNGWDHSCTAIGFLGQHMGLSKSLTVLSICLFLFMLAICQVKMHKPVHEVTGVLCVVFLPALTSWVPFIGSQYGLIGVWCWIKYDCLNPTQTEMGSYFRIGASVLLDIAPHTLSIILISSVAIVFWKRSCCHTKTSLRQSNWLALKEVSPLVCYPLASALALLVGTANNVVVKVESTRIDHSRYVGEMATLCLMQTANLAIPISFLLHPSIRRGIVAKLKDMGSRRYNSGGNKVLQEVNESTVNSETRSLIVEGKPLS